MEEMKVLVETVARIQPWTVIGPQKYVRGNGDKGITKKTNSVEGASSSFHRIASTEQKFVDV